MMAIDMTGQLAPILWVVEGLMLFAVAWLLGSYCWQQVHADRRPAAVGPRGRNGHEAEPTSEKLAA